MSRKVRIDYTARDKRDGKEMLRWIEEYVSRSLDDVDIQVLIDNRSSKTEQESIPDEHLETKVNSLASAELDRLDELAAAAYEYSLSPDRLKALRKRRALQIESSRKWGEVLRSVVVSGWSICVQLLKTRISG